MAGIDSLQSLFEDELKDIYDAEKQITKALPKMIKKAGAEELKAAFDEHLQQTQQHIERLEQVFELLEMPARGKKCVGMQNLIKEGQEMMDEDMDEDAMDAALSKESVRRWSAPGVEPICVTFVVMNVASANDTEGASVRATAVQNPKSDLSICDSC